MTAKKTPAAANAAETPVPVTGEILLRQLAASGDEIANRFEDIRQEDVRRTDRVSTLLVTLVKIAIGLLLVNLAAIAAAIIIFLVIDQHANRQRNETLAETKVSQETLQTLKNALSPAAQAQSAAQTQAFVDQIVKVTDCNVRRDLVDVLARVRPPIAIALPATASCPAYTPAP